MENLLSCDGRIFSCKIKESPVIGKIRVEDGFVYLCQNKHNGSSCEDKFGYRYSWKVCSGSKHDLEITSVTDFRLGLTAAEIESYKDWQVGDVIRINGITREVIFRSGELVVCKELDNKGILKKGSATGNYTCNELYDIGYRLVAEPVEDETGIVEVTMDEIAKMKGVPVERLRVKKEE